MATIGEELQRIAELKARLDAGRPFSPAAVARLREHLLVAWTHHSTAIEGNTLSLQETRAVLLDGVTVGGKTLREHLEVVNHRDAVEWLEALVAGPREPVGERHVLELHRLVLKGIWPEEAGRYRRTAVRIAGSRHVPPAAHRVPDLMREFGLWLEAVTAGAGSAAHPAHTSPEAPSVPATAGAPAVLVAAEAHLRLVAVHPFADGNGRTARLLLNLILMREGYPPAVIEVGERPRYYDTLEQATVEGKAEPFHLLVAEAARRSLALALEALVPSQP